MSKLLDLFSDLTGVVLDYALSSPPSAQWLMCYGQALALGDAASAKLRAKLIADGYPYGQDGTNPRVPDVRSRVTAGRDNMGGTAANRLTTAAGGIDGKTLGATGGAQAVTLTVTEMPSHSHGVNDTGHEHTVPNPTGLTVGSGGVNSDSGVSTANRLTSKVTTGITVQDAGGNSPHSNTQPTLIMNKIIRL